MDKREIISYPDPLTGLWVRGYRDEKGDLVIVSDEGEEDGNSISAPQPPARHTRRKDSVETDMAKLTVKMTREEHLRFQQFCRWYSLTSRPTSMSTLVRELIESLYRKYPAFREFERKGLK